MHTTINTADTDIVEEERDGDRYLVAKRVPIVQPMELSNGYVPEESIKSSLRQENTHGGTGWGGVTVTLNHPRNLPEFDWHDPMRPNGEPVLASNDGVEDTLGLGELEEDHWDGQYIRADVAVNVDRAEEMGGEASDVADALESDKPLNVSTQYIGSQLPPGEYDGRERDRAEAIVAPDSLALLPNAPGQCSVEEGCGVNAPATPLATANNATVHIQTGHVGANASADSADSGNTPSTANATSDPVWSGLGGSLRKIAADLNELQERGVVGDDGLIRQLSIDVNEAIGMWRSHDEAMGGDGELPGPLSREEERATVNADSLSRQALLQTAISSNQYPSDFPFSGKSECIDEMEGEVDDAGAFCNAWYESSNDAEASANGTGTIGAESPVDDGTEIDDMRTPTGNATSHELRLDLWGDMMTGVLEAGDEDDLHVAQRLLAAEMPGVDVQTVREEFDPDEMDDFDTATVRDRISALADTINNPGSNKDDYENTANMEREDLIKEITTNSNIKRESLEGMGDTCLQTTHENIVANSDDDTDDPVDDDDDVTTDADDDADADNDSDTVVMEKDELESFIDEKVEQRVAANEQRRTREERVETIVANSAEYDSDDKEELMETPDSVLERIEKGLGGGMQFPATSAPTVNSEEDADDTDVDLGTGVMN